MRLPPDIPPRAQRDLLRARPAGRSLARDLRKNLSKPEAWLWKKLCRRQTGFLFHRQKPLGPYIADFYCHEARLVIEIDGYSHSSRGKEDRRRDEWMNTRGITVMRMSAREVFEDLDGVVGRIRGECLRLAAIWNERKSPAKSPDLPRPRIRSATPSAGAEGDGGRRSAAER